MKDRNVVDIKGRVVAVWLRPYGPRPVQMAEIAVVGRDGKEDFFLCEAHGKPAASFNGKCGRFHPVYVRGYFMNSLSPRIIVREVSPASEKQEDFCRFKVSGIVKSAERREGSGIQLSVSAGSHTVPCSIPDLAAGNNVFLPGAGISVSGSCSGTRHTDIQGMTHFVVELSASGVELEMFREKLCCEHWTCRSRSDIAFHFLVVKDSRGNPVWINHYHGDEAALLKDVSALKEHGSGAVDRGFGNLVNVPGSHIRLFLDEMNADFTERDPTARLVDSFRFDVVTGECREQVRQPVPAAAERDSGGMEY